MSAFCYWRACDMPPLIELTKDNIWQTIRYPLRHWLLRRNIYAARRLGRLRMRRARRERFSRLMRRISLDDAYQARAISRPIYHFTADISASMHACKFPSIRAMLTILRHFTYHRIIYFSRLAAVIRFFTADNIHFTPLAARFTPAIVIIYWRSRSIDGHLSICRHSGDDAGAALDTIAAPHSLLRV